MSVATTKPIEATSMDGDFVLRTQELAKSEGFGNVSKIWYEKTQPISEVVEEALQHASRAETVSRTLDAIAATVDSQGNFRIRDRISGQDWIPAKHVIGQLGNICGIGSAYPTLLFQKGTPSASELLTRVFNFHLGCKPTKGRRFNLRLRNKQRLSGIVSENSSVVENAWYLKVLQRLVPDGRISHWKSDEDSILGNLLISDTMRKESDSEYGAMLSLRSSEVQVYRFCQRPSLFRAICMNGCIWGQTKKVRDKH